jgi:hypothetical protein
MRRVQKHDIKKYRKNKSDPSPFSYSDSPTHHGGRRFFFCRPLAKPLKMLNEVGRHLSPFFVCVAFFFYGVFVRFSARGVKNTRESRKKMGEVHVKRPFTKKLRGKKLVFCHSFPSIFNRSFVNKWAWINVNKLIQNLKSSKNLKKK